MAKQQTQNTSQNETYEIIESIEVDTLPTSTNHQLSSGVNTESTNYKPRLDLIKLLKRLAIQLVPKQQTGIKAKDAFKISNTTKSDTQKSYIQLGVRTTLVNQFPNIIALYNEVKEESLKALKLDLSNLDKSEKSVEDIYDQNGLVSNINELKVLANPAITDKGEEPTITPQLLAKASEHLNKKKLQNQQEIITGNVTGIRLKEAEILHTTDSGDTIYFLIPLKHNEKPIEAHLMAHKLLHHTVTVTLDDPELFYKNQGNKQSLTTIKDIQFSIEEADILEGLEAHLTNELPNQSMDLFN